MTIRNMKILTGILVVTGAVVLTGGIYFTFAGGYPGKPTSVDEAIDFVGSDDFKDMPRSKRMEYLNSAKDIFEDMPKKERHKLRDRMRHDEMAQRAMQAAMREMMVKHAKMFKQASPTQQAAIIDSIIYAQEQGRQRRMEKLKKHGNSPEAKKKRAKRVERHKKHFHKFVAEGNPQILGMMGEGIKVINKRREQKGLPKF